MWEDQGNLDLGRVGHNRGDGKTSSLSVDLLGGGEGGTYLLVTDRDNRVSR